MKTQLLLVQLQVLLLQSHDTSACTRLRIQMLLWQHEEGLVYYMKNIHSMQDFSSQLSVHKLLAICNRSIWASQRENVQHEILQRSPMKGVMSII